MIALKTIDLGWRQLLDYYYNLTFSDLIFLFVFSFFISALLHIFFRNRKYNISSENQAEIIEVKNYSFVTKTLVVFFILVLFCTPIFKLLNTGYFL